MLQNVPPIRLVALDLDGTLLNHEGKVTSRTRAALQAAADRGVAIVPTTGRPLGNLPPVVAQLPGIRYAITSNGAAVWDLGDDPLAAVYSRYSNAAQRRHRRRLGRLSCRRRFAAIGRDDCTTGG